MDAYFYSENFAFSSEEQMATDEWMLLQTDKCSSFGFRVYQMAETCTIGRNQKFDLIKERTEAHKTLVRRPTGGGTVFHGDDLIYTLTIPSQHALYELKLGDLYNEIHSLVNRVFKYFSLEAELYEECVKTLPDFCFDSPNRFDLLSCENGAKLGGSAIKKSKKGILIQGSLAVDFQVELFAEQFLKEMMETFDLESIKTPRENPRMCCHWRDFCNQFTSDYWNFKL
jgi:lipoate-protein ligase A